MKIKQNKPEISSLKANRRISWETNITRNYGLHDISLIKATKIRARAIPATPRPNVANDGAVNLEFPNPFWQQLNSSLQNIFL
jgi:hypothetical protein